MRKNKTDIKIDEAIENRMVNIAQLDASIKGYQQEIDEATALKMKMVGALEQLKELEKE